MGLPPSSADAAFREGLAAAAGARWEVAAKAFAEAARLRPNWWEVWARLATVHDARRDWPASVAAYEEALKFAAPSAPILCNLGMALLGKRDFNAALQRFEQAATLPPPIPEVFNGRGVALKALNRFDEAIGAFEQALRLRPDQPDWLCNLGNTFAAAHAFDQAHRAYDRVLQVRPGDGDAVFGKALAYLICGDLERGFALYDARWQSELKGCQRKFAVPPWDGRASLQGKVILVHCEQGLGDTLQFVRYAPLLAELGARVWLEVQQSLVELCRTVAGVEAVYAERTAPAGFEMTASLLSLPALLRTNLQTIPLNVPYLRSDPTKRSEWARRFADAPAPRIGWVPSGNLHHKNDHNRSIPLAQFAAAMRTGLGSGYVLPKDLTPADKAFLDTHQSVRHLGTAFGDFTDTAAAIEELDMVVTVDTSLAHLAGALGKRTWLLLPYAPDWRWLLDRKDSPWYPSLTLYRQKSPGDWSDVLAQVGRDLQRLTA